MEFKPAKNNIGYISASRTGTFSKCKLQFYKSVIEDNRDQYANGTKEDQEIAPQEDESLYFTFGTIVHKALEIFWKNPDKQKRNRGFLIELFRKYYKEYGLANRDYYNLGMDMLENYYEYASKDAPKRKFITGEAFFDFLLLGREYYQKLGVISLSQMAHNASIEVKGTNNAEELINALTEASQLPRAKGTIDAIFYHGNGLYEIVDYKTSVFMPSQDEIDNNIQLALYDLAFMEASDLRKFWIPNHPPKNILLTMHFLRHGSKGVIQTSIDVEARQRNKKYFLDTFEQMSQFNKQDFTATLSVLCPYCAYCSTCDKYQNVLNSDINADEQFISKTKIDTAKHCVQTQERLKARIKILQSRLDESNEMFKTIFSKEYLNDSLIVNDREYYITNYTRKYLLPALTYKVLIENDLFDPKVLLDSVSVGKVEELCKKYPEVWEELESKALRVHTGAPMIRSRKVKK